MSKRNRTRYLGAYREASAPAIDVPFTIANLRDLLVDGAGAEGRYTHQQIKDWAARFWWTQWERPLSSRLEVSSDVEAAAELAQDVEMQWDMFLVNTYTLDELQRLDFSRVRLPEEWFADWALRPTILRAPTDGQ